MATAPDATQPGVSNEDNEAKEPQPTARELAMEAISVHREDGSDQVVDPPAQGQNEPTADQVALQVGGPQVLESGLDKIMVRAKIDGVERLVSVDEMQRQFQKNGAAEQRLERATRAEAEAARLLAEARSATVPPVGVASGSEPGDSTGTPGGDDSDQVADELFEAMLDGDKDAVRKAVKKVGRGRQQPTPVTDELVAQLTPAIKQQLVVESALEQFAVDYADVVKDPYLAQMADGFLEAEVAGGKPFTEALAEAGKKTRDWLTSKGVTTSAPTPTIPRNAKLERKAGIDSIPALNTKAMTIEEPVQSASDVINEMRAARGLAV